MTSSDRPIRSILVVGGGTAGWMAALMLAGRLARQNVTITLVESAEIGTVGVGEATVPAIRDYFRDTGLDAYEVMRRTQGTMKLGIEFADWNRAGETFFHPFALYGSASRGVAFQHFWLKRRAAGDPTPFSAYSLGTQLAMADRFMPPPEAPTADFGVFDWAVHFDAGLFARYLAEVAQSLGVARINGTVSDTRLHPETGFIESVGLQDGTTLSADLFLDCTGFRSLMLGGALGTPYDDWSDLLPCDRAVAVPCERTKPLTPYTRSTARAAGWQWRIPLQHRVGNGYVYASDHISDDEAVSTLLRELEGPALAEPNLLRFTTGKRQKLWVKNCVALGLAAGFMEPLESTSITLIQSGIERLCELFPNRSFDPALAAEYNRTTALEYEGIRDFLLLHYWANKRLGEPMWDACRSLKLPERLEHKIRLFRARGKLVRYEWEAFSDPSWLSMYNGFDLWPATYDPLADYFSESDLAAALGKMREAISRAMMLPQRHDDFVAANCR